MQRPTWFGGTGSFLNCIARGARRKRRSTERAGGANLRFEPLEHRHLLSVGPVGDGQDELIAYGDVPESTEVYAATETPEATGDVTEVSRHRVPVRFAVRTEERIEDLPSFIEGLALPDELGYIDPTTADIEVVLPGWLGGETGYKTIIGGTVVTTLDEDTVVAQLNELDCFEFMKLEADCVVRFGPNAQESIDNLTRGASSTERIIRAYGDEASPARRKPIEVDVAVETPYRMTDLAKFVESQEWPEELGPVGAHNVEQLVTIPLNFADRSEGYKTYFRIEVRGDISALDQVDFLTFARLSSESHIKYTRSLQESIDRITTGAPSGSTRINDPIVVTDTAVAPESPPEVPMHPVRVRLTFRTEERIEDVELFVAGIELPDEVGYLHPGTADVQIVYPERSGIRDDFKTVVDVTAFSTLDEENIVAELKQLDCFDFVQLKSESSIKYTERLQELVDAQTHTGSDMTGGFFGEEVTRPAQQSTDVQISFWSQERVTNVAEMLESQQWPESFGVVSKQDFEQLISIPILSEERGGFRTIVRMRFRGDLADLDRVQFIDDARLEEESAVRWTPELQQLYDARTTTGSSLTGHFFSEEVAFSTALRTLQSESLINMDAFRSDTRFDGIDGNGSSVVVVDSGIDVDHPYFGDDDDLDGIADRIVYQEDFADEDMDASDTLGHGTNVAGIAASEDSTRTGMAPGADIIALKISPDNSGTIDFADVESALEWVGDNIATFNIGSVNMSFGTGNYQSSPTLTGIDDDIALLEAAGVLVVSASGNSYHVANGDEVQGVAYPSADANSLSVGAVYDANIGQHSLNGAIATTTAADQVAAFSQRDDQLTTVMAPGALITSAGLDGGTSTYAGTSQAAPHIAGIALLAQQLAMQELGQHLTQTQFADLLDSTGTTVTDDDNGADNVDDTDLDFARVDMFDLAEGILDLRIVVDADDDPAAGSQKDDGTPDTFVVSRSGTDIIVQVNGSTIHTVANDSLD